MQADDTYWPLVETLAQVLNELGDHEEYERVAAHLLRFDPQCPSIQLINDKRARESISSEGHVLGGAKPSGRVTEAARRRSAQAQRRLDHLHDKSAQETKRRKLMHESVQQQLEASCRPRPYRLQQLSWQGLGKLLLEAFEDSMDTSDGGSSTRGIYRGAISIRVDAKLPTGAESDRPAVEESEEPKVVPVGEDVGTESEQTPDAPEPSGGKTTRPAKRQKATRKTSVDITADRGTASTSDNDDTHDSGVATTSDADELMPVRRKSRRNEQRLKDEHAAAVKKAREKNLAYRLKAFLSGPETNATSSSTGDIPDHQDAEALAAKVSWSSPLSVELSGSTFRFLDAENNEIAQTNAFGHREDEDEDEDTSVKKKTSSSSQPSSSSATASRGSAADDRVSVAQSLAATEVAEFVAHFAGQPSDEAPSSACGLLDLIQGYLNQCGEWAQVKLGSSDDEDLQVVFSWLERTINGELDPDAEPSFASASGIELAATLNHSATIRELTLRARLFLLELRYDTLLREYSSRTDRSRRQQLKTKVKSLISKAQGILLDVCWAEDADDADVEDNEPFSRVDFVRTYWLVARMYERMGDPHSAQLYYSKCQERLQSSKMNGTTSEPVENAQEPIEAVMLPNQKFDQQISLNILEEKLSELRFSDVYLEACQLYEKQHHDEVISALFGYIFPANQPPRLMDLLDEFQPGEDITISAIGTPTAASGGADGTAATTSRKLFPIILDSIDKSEHFSVEGVVRLLLTILHHIVVFFRGLGPAVSKEKADTTSGSHSDDDTRFHALIAMEFLLKHLKTKCAAAESISAEHCLLLRGCCLNLLDPVILLMFESPADVFALLWSLLDIARPRAGDQGDAPSSLPGRVTESDAVGHLLYQIRSFSNDDFRDLFAAAPDHSAKKRQPRRERVRQLLVEILRYLNRELTRDEAVAAAFPAEKQRALMLLCIDLMKQEEEAIAKNNNHKIPQQLFGNSAVLFLLLFAAHSADTSARHAERRSVVELVSFLHERIGQHGMCGLDYGESEDPQRSGPDFLETCVSLLIKHASDAQRNPKRADAAEEGQSDRDEEDEKLEQELAQCYRCLYDVQIVSGCADHKAGRTFASLQAEDDPALKCSKTIELARFAIPILLENRPKNNGHKKENLKLLYAIRDALAGTRLLDAALTRRQFSPQLGEYVNPDGLLRWRDDDEKTLTYVQSTGSESMAGDDDEDVEHLSHLWYLLGENFILGRVRRRNNLVELIDMEARVRERASFLLKDVLYCHPERMESWVLLGETMKEQCHVTTDACALVFGRHKWIAALQAYTSMYETTTTSIKTEKIDVDSLLNPADDSSSSKSFTDVVLNGSLFKRIKQWKDHRSAPSSADDKAAVPARSDEGQRIDEGAQATQDALEIQQAACEYIAQVIEFARRSFEMAARLGAASLEEKQVNEKTKKENDDSKNSEQAEGDDEEEEEEKEELRDSVVECYEEAGLILYNVLQEFSLLKEGKVDRFPYGIYSQVVERALLCFRNGLALCGASDDGDVDEARFRLYYMIGKTLKKKRWVQSVLDHEGRQLDVVGEIMHCFSTAESIRQEGNMGEHALVHAFYALQAVRMELLLSESPSVEELRLVGKYFYVEADDEEDDEEDTGSSGGEGKEEGDDVVKKRDGPGKKQVERDAKAQVETDEAAPSMAGNAAEIVALLDRVTPDGMELDVAVAIVKGWLMLNVIEALEAIPDEDRYFHPSRYVLARAVYWLSEHYANELLPRMSDDTVAPLLAPLISAVEEHRSVSTVDGAASDAAARALKELAPVFDKKRPQIVAIWFSEYIPSAKKFEELNQRQIKYDFYRLKYWRYLIRLLQENEAYGRLKEVGSWVLACKEDHDAIDLMLGIVLKARGVVLRKRVRELLPPLPESQASEHSVAVEKKDEEEAEALLKQLAKAYSYYLDVADAQSRLVGVVEQSQLMLENAELPMVCLFVLATTAFAQFVQPSAHARELLVVDDEFETNVNVIKDALRRDELPPRIYDALGREAWQSFLMAARSFCEERWPERTGKAKAPKSRARAKPAAAATQATGPASVSASGAVVQTATDAAASSGAEVAQGK